MAQLLLCRAHPPTYTVSVRHAPARHEMPAGGTTFVASTVSPQPSIFTGLFSFTSARRFSLSVSRVSVVLSGRLNIIYVVHGSQCYHWQRKCHVIFAHRTENSQLIASGSVDTVSAFRLNHSCCILQLTCLHFLVASTSDVTERKSKITTFRAVLMSNESCQIMSP